MVSFGLRVFGMLSSPACLAMAAFGKGCGGRAELDEFEEEVDLLDDEERNESAAQAYGM